jgi:hypothetical protein
MDLLGLAPFLFLLERLLLSFCLDRCDPLEELLAPEVSSWASLLTTILAELSSELELSEDVALLLRGLYEGFSGDGVGGVVVEGRVCIFALGVEWVHGFEVFNAAIA